ncbi:hypothetical protein [Burkholderia anthina]|nr:hypothetical protein [Burkholderia anthina]
MQDVPASGAPVESSIRRTGIRFRFGVLPTARAMSEEKNEKRLQ